MDKQHVQLPNRKDNEEILPREQLIYIAIRRYMNSKTLEAFPSLSELSKKTGASITTIRAAIARLVKLDYISIRKEGRKNIYKFNQYKQFEPFSYEFLDNDKLTFIEKAYLVATQQYMFKVDGTGSVSLPNRELARKINMPESTIRSCNKSLRAKNFLEIAENKNRDIITGCATETKIFQLNKFGQAIIFALQNHEKRISQTEAEQEHMKKRMELLERAIRNRPDLRIDLSELDKFDKEVENI